MASPGTKPLPTIFKLVNGNDKRVRADEPIPKGDLYDAPEELTPSQKEKWDYAIKHSPAGMLRSLDRDLLRLWAVATDLHHQAMLEVKKTGLTYTTPGTSTTTIMKDGRTKIVTCGGVIINSPALGILNKQAQIILKVTSELGFSPTSRTRISTGGGKGKEKENKFSNNSRGS